MIRYAHVYIFNTSGKPRLVQNYVQMDTAATQELMRTIFALVARRPDSACNFLETSGIRLLDGDHKIIYRHYATLYFVFVVDSSESELGILDLIQVFVETLDRTFENVCELDLIFSFTEVHYILNEVIAGGLVVNMISSSLSQQIQAHQKAAGFSGRSSSS
ncbi:AP complex, mu/sigma subunit [Hyaloraphidium curvatum]|nr:AP complex, mu/sigma subunit [Hyaloraphidium curvatum]